MRLFLSTPSARRATPLCELPGLHADNFYPRPPRGGRPSCTASHKMSRLFLSTPSARRATGHLANLDLSGIISIHALREEGDEIHLCLFCLLIYFYPRPPRGGRPGVLLFLEGVNNISIHALREEGDRGDLDLFAELVTFLSTPSARRATCGGFHQQMSPPYFYPRPPRGGRQQKQRQNLYFQTNYTTFCTNLEEP